MNSTEKEIYYSVNNSYSTLNALTKDTKNVWFVCHGMGYLSRYFIKYFKGLDPNENYIVAPQAQSKYYLTPKFKHVGASWLTRENTEIEITNVLAYYDAIFEKEQLISDKNLIVLGYSQGVSVAMRYVAKRQLQCKQLILHSGGIPNELIPEDFQFYNGSTTLVYGTKDEYLTNERMEKELSKANMLFTDNLEVISFDGPHEVNVEVINKLV
ncbi:esterase [Psychroserpens sp.]|uniref:alpha/beta hydrolase n=1 Tax=Psychroserpens sp. TaxID=2020870 RepID=UPI001B0065A8|nr:esterase [Psychroserpens sp.]MBO6606632.1 esterase [Psychroserpens sp.]MBO6631730.1 esterase [Psychroserpens sp.]MBO6653336.1 esterase [Psychroserpens sp.]MBO6680637.1 esterase [Psychroserpens sp.]MBO6750405.1 esterase [Psychroserpens sp.]